MSFINEPARSIPVSHEADICVLGGSCTGLFAAVRAARLGARVVIVEKDNCFGGIATTSMVNVWHSLWSTDGQRQIIAGLTSEVIERLEHRGALRRYEKTNPSTGFAFNSEELKIELDQLALDSSHPSRPTGGAAGGGRLEILFHTVFVAPSVNDDGRLEAVFIENKSGRSAIKAALFIDATGDGDLAHRLGCPSYTATHTQPSTACARFSGWETLGDYSHRYGELLRQHGPDYGLPAGFAWGSDTPASRTHMLAATRIQNIDPANAADLTRGEIEGRRQVRAIHDLLRRAVPGSDLRLEALPARLGLRESRHIRCAYQLTGDDVLGGRSFDDTIAQGSYRVDIHHQEKPGITLRYLDGTETYNVPGHPQVRGRWRPENTSAGTPDPVYYQIPYRSLLPQGGHDNVIVAGRMLDADPVANGAIRVMVNLNQTGEAAGVAAVLALRDGTGFPQVDPVRLRAALRDGGSTLE
ncbi:FAD-dependent oxidoreductase [Opitutaceae bacterium TAV4]|nr:FAD-dependent oxidoreductase [Opitutaceae bacterium TAV3]RRK01415.1 FAD-dependent oxidoreductase [Opitutaceae bacterium TAV4]